MARPKTAQPNHSLRKVAAVVATAVSGMSVYAQAAEQPKQEETITVVAAPAAESAGTGADYRGKTLRHGDQNRYPD
ncbi:hypothetical protein KPZU09_38830 [Klebsiella pneumoniae]|uniref:Ferrichrome outer membrane transporter n=1 Tax=Klebsiella pneumoniae TaxID=573 RepID=A0A919M037_KLEPN|nr:hypothetical protein KPZU09_38830 [Klebsiella pneumoniae]